MRLLFLKSTAWAAAFAGAALALHAGEGDCHAPARECTQQIRQMLSARRYLGIQIVELKPGLVIKTVLPDSPATAYLKAGDRLIAVNGRSLEKATVGRFKQHLAESNTGKVMLIVLRRGAFRRIEVRLEPYPKEYIEKAISAHLSQAHPATAGAQP